MKIKGLISENTIVLKYEGQEVNIQRQEDEQLFQQVAEMLLNRDEKNLIGKFLDIKSRIEKFSNNLFEVNSGKVTLKGDNKPIPDVIVKKLLELEKSGGDFLPLIRFWKKLRKNPSEQSQQQLYGFMLHNNIPLTEQGDIVVEKGVSQKPGGLPGELVDSYTGKVDNSVGMIVEMPREQVDDNPNRTCSFGLHVGAPDYVRQWYGQDIIVKCVVNPTDVVSVPTDYNNTKMRVCRYQVMGYSTKSHSDSQVVKLSDFIKTPDVETEQKMRAQSKANKSFGTGKKVKYVKAKPIEQLKVVETNPYIEKLKSMTAKDIMKYVEQQTGTKMTDNPKNKRSILKKAAGILEAYEATKQLTKDAESIDTEVSAGTNQSTLQNEIDLSKLNRKQTMQLVKDKFNEELNKFLNEKAVKNKARELFEQAGYTVIG